MIVLLMLAVAVIVILCVACILLKRRLRYMEQHLSESTTAANGMGEYPYNKSASTLNPEVPMVSMPPLATKTDDGEEEEGEEMPKRKIVVADDNADMRNSLAKQLSADFEVLLAENGEQGLALVRENNPDIVVSDVHMPVMSGYELCHKLRQDAETDHIPIILISALSERENIIYGLESGADDYVVKPFDMAVLHTRILSILKRKQEQLNKVENASLMRKIELKSQQDKEFMENVTDIVNEHLANSEFSINDLCMEMGMSRSSLYGKIKVLTGHGPNDLIKTIRMDKARELLQTHRLNVGEVAYRVGFSDPKYFSTCFKKQFGISPTKV